MNSLVDKTYRTSVLLSDGNKIVCEWGSLPDTLATALAFAQEFEQVIDVEEDKEDGKQQLIMQVNKAIFASKWQVKQF